MSDSTANAREPSMEDILASIRRIIDEEDTRDGRPPADHDSRSEDRDFGVDGGAMPVMTAASVNRDSSVDEGFDEPITESEETLDHDGDTIFPERESPFWSRATGREASESDDDVDDSDESLEVVSRSEELREQGADAPTFGTPTDIFTRAQNKLGTTSRLSTRERIQGLAAQAEERANQAIARNDSVAPDLAEVPDSIEDIATDSGPDAQPHADAFDESTDAIEEKASFSALPAADEENVLELTDPIEEEGSSDDALVIRAGGAMTQAETISDDVREEVDQDVEETAAFEELPQEPTSSARQNGDNDGTHGHKYDMDDVLDLTTPIDDEELPIHAGNVENGEPFHTSDVDEDDAGNDGIEKAISENLSTHTTDAQPDDVPEIETGTSALSAAEEETAPSNTYSRFESDEYLNDTSPEADTDEVASSEEYSAAFMMLDDEPAESHEPEQRAGYSADEEELPGEPGENRLETEDDLGFSDTFGASDVYHEDPPTLDEDYSRSFEDGEKLAAEQAAFAAQMQEDDEGMEAVGGMVRDAMERDPVDYADPAALVSMTSEEISARALASLADVEGEASRRVYGSLKISESSDGSDSLEGMVRGMLKPMLREWLDDNLPTMVETAVRGEVERISAKSRKYSRAADND